MYPSQQSQGDATPSERRQTDPDFERDSFRPVALPALAAAVRRGVTPKPAARAGEGSPLASRFLHEDTPLG